MSASSHCFATSPFGLFSPKIRQVKAKQFSSNRTSGPSNTDCEPLDSMRQAYEGQGVPTHSDSGDSDGGDVMRPSRIMGGDGTEVPGTVVRIL